MNTRWIKVRLGRAPLAKALSEWVPDKRFALSGAPHLAYPAAAITLRPVAPLPVNSR